MKFTKVIKAEFEDKFSDEWLSSNLQSLINWAKQTKDLLRDGKIELKHKRIIKSLIQNMFEQLDNASRGIL